MMKKRKFKYFGHHVCGEGTVRVVIEGGMRGRCGRGRPRGNWIGNLEEWSGKGGVEFGRMAKDQGGRKRIVYDCVHPWQSQLRGKL